MRVSHSRIKRWRQCKKSHDYRYNQKLKKKAPALPLLRGRIIGESLDQLVAGKNWRAVIDHYATKYRSLFREEQEMYGDLIGDCTKIIEGYARTHLQDSLKYEHTEFPVEVQLRQDITFVGKIDKVAMDKSGRRWLIDHKSHRSIPGDDQRAADIQSVFYFWAWNEMHPEDPADGFMWDYLRTKPPTVPEVLKNGQLSKRQNIDTDVHTYREAIKANGLNPADYQDMIEMLDKQENSFFKRVFLPNPNKAVVANVVEEMRTEAILIAQLGDVVATRSLTRDCPSCEFFALCQAELRGHDSSTIRKKDYVHAEEDNISAN